MTLAEGGLIAAGATNILLGLAVYSRNSRARANLLFLLLGSSVAAWNWGIAAFIMAQDVDQALLFANLYYLAALGIGASLYLFVQEWLQVRKLFFSYLRQTIIMVLWAAAVIAFPHSIVKEFFVSSGGERIAHFNVLGQTLYSLVFLYLFLRATLVLVIYLKKASGERKSQIQFVTLGVVSAGAIGVLFNLILPWFGVYEYIWVGPIASVFFVGFVGFSIAKHKMFNIQATAARAFAYLLAVSAVGGVYALALVILSSVNVITADLASAQRILFVALAVFSGFFYRPARNFFDRITNKLFYRDAYDAQTLIDELNKTLVDNVDLEVLLHKSASIIQEYLKTSYCAFYIRETSYFPSRVLGTGGKKRLNNLDEITDTASQIQGKVFSVDQMDDEAEHQLLTRGLRSNNIEVMARLVSTPDDEAKGIGLIFFWPKRSGIPYSKDDLKIIEIIANGLVIAVENVLRFEEIEQFNVTLQKRVEEATRKYRAANERLRQLDETKDEFISMASHQLRTPLTSVKGYLSMVLDGDAGKVTKQQEELLKQSFLSSQRMVNLIADLLNLSRLNTGKFVIEPTAVDLRDVVRAEMLQLRETAKAKGITLEYENPKDFSTIMLDETKTQQVVMNFMDNALYYTPAGGKVIIELSETAHAVELRVKDNGIGVPRAQQKHLFTKFYRADNAKRARPDGTGLGIFMAKKVIVAQNGAVIFESEEGKGSTFGFRFNKPRGGAS